MYFIFNFVTVTELTQSFIFTNIITSISPCSIRNGKIPHLSCANIDLSCLFNTLTTYGSMQIYLTYKILTWRHSLYHYSIGNSVLNTTLTIHD